MKRSLWIQVAFVYFAATAAAPVEDDKSGPSPSEVGEALVNYFSLKEHVNALLEPFAQKTPFLPDPSTVLLIDMYAQTRELKAGEYIRDLSGKGNHAKIVGSPIFNSKDAGCMNSIQFDEADLLYVANSASLRITWQITIEAWVQTTTDMGYLLLKKGSYGFPKFLANHFVFSYLHGKQGYPNFSLEQPKATDGDWHYFAMTYDGKVLRYYLDGELSKELARVGTIQTTANRIIIGHSEGWHKYGKANFAGKFSALRVSNRARSHDEIRHSANVGIALLHGCKW